MSITVNIISTIFKNIAGNKIQNELAREVFGVSIDALSENGINKLKDIIYREEAKFERILSHEYMKSLNVPEEDIDYITAEIKNLISEVEITDDVFRKCRYDEAQLSKFLWDNYRKHKGGYPECASDIKKVLDCFADELIELITRSEKFEKEILVQISNSLDDTNADIEQISRCMGENFNGLNTDNKAILKMLQEISEQLQNNEQSHGIKKRIRSRTQEYSNKWNENMFLNDFDKRDRDVGINVTLGEVYKESHLPAYIWKSDADDKACHDLKDLLIEYIEAESKNQMLLILGQPGIGKSTLITWITANLTDCTDNILVYRFASDLKSVNWRNTDSEYDIAGDILKALGLTYDDIEGKTLILDGFDEIYVEDDRADLINGIYLKLVKKSMINHFSLIITCRENFILRLDRVQCSYITLQPWNKVQIQSFCAVYLTKTQLVVSVSTLEKILENTEVFGIPLILYMVLALNILIEKDSSILDVYDRIFSLDNGIYDRCIENRNFEARHRISAIKEDIHQISREIAMWMLKYSPNEACIETKEYEKICENVMARQAKEKDHIKKDFLIGNYFRLAKYSEGNGTEYIYFIHRSIYEYFVTDTIFTSMEQAINTSKINLAGVLGKLLNGNLLPANVLEFLKLKISKSGLKGRFDTVNEAFQIMIRDGMTYYTGICYKYIFERELYVFANMLEILHLFDFGELKLSGLISKYINCRKCVRHSSVDVYFNLCKATLKEHSNLDDVNLYGSNLRGIRLCSVFVSDANLSYADLTEAFLFMTHLNNTLLYSANLNGANMTSAQLRGADLCKADLRGANLVGADLKNANLKYAYLENSIWRREDIEKAAMQMKEADFDYIYIYGSNGTEKIHRRQLFPE